MMFKKDNRLTSKDFESFTNAKHVHFSNFRIVYSPTNTETKIATIISKKIEKSAVKRNKIKRRINGIIQKNYKTVFTKKIAIAIYVKREIKKSSTSDLKKDIDSFFTSLSN